MTTRRPHTGAEIREADEARELRQLRERRDAALTPAERLARVHELCRQLATIRSAATRER